MKNIAVLIRTYSRILDTEALIHIIKTQWTKHNYTIFVVHNGESDGHHASQFIKDNCTLIQISHNSGHRTGATTLVQEGLKNLKNYTNFSHYIFIESDFWLLDDTIIDTYLNKLEKNNTKLATTVWVEKVHSLAVDFFIAEANFLQNNSYLLDWDNHAEQYFSKNMPKNVVTIISELRPTHLPKLARKLPLDITLVDGGRFRIFPKAKALTHHIETLNNNQQIAINIKKGLANSLGNKNIFPNIENVPLPKFLAVQYISKFIPQSWWYKQFFK